MSRPSSTIIRLSDDNSRSWTIKQARGEGEKYSSRTAKRKIGSFLDLFSNLSAWFANLSLHAKDYRFTIPSLSFLKIVLNKITSLIMKFIFFIFHEYFLMNPFDLNSIVLASSLNSIETSTIEFKERTKEANKTSSWTSNDWLHDLINYDPFRYTPERQFS